MKILSVTPGLQKEWENLLVLRTDSRKKLSKRKTYWQKSLKHESFKKYWKQIINLPRVSKQAHYNNYIRENKNNCKAIWIGINEIIYRSSQKLVQIYKKRSKPLENIIQTTP